MEHFSQFLSRSRSTSCRFHPFVTLRTLPVNSCHRSVVTVVNSTTKGGHELLHSDHPLSEEKILFETVEKTFHYKYSFLATWPAWKMYSWQSVCRTVFEGNIWTHLSFTQITTAYSPQSKAVTLTAKDVAIHLPQFENRVELTKTAGDCTRLHWLTSDHPSAAASKIDFAPGQLKSTLVTPYTTRPDRHHRSNIWELAS